MPEDPKCNFFKPKPRRCSADAGYLAEYEAAVGHAEHGLAAGAADLNVAPQDDGESGKENPYPGMHYMAEAGLGAQEAAMHHMAAPDAMQQGVAPGQKLDVCMHHHQQEYHGGAHMQPSVDTPVAVMEQAAYQT